MNDWINYFYAYVDYVYDHKAYPKREQTYNGYSIGNWEARQRKIKNNGRDIGNGTLLYKGEILTKEQIKMLNDINFIWDKRDYNWMNNYNLLIEYIEKFGRYPKIYEEYQGVILSSWIDRIRNAFSKGIMQEDGSIRTKRGILTSKQIKLLNDINFRWVGNQQLYFKNTISTKEELEKKKYYLEILLDRMLKEKEYDTNNTKLINKDFIKVLEQK